MARCSVGLLSRVKSATGYVLVDGLTSGLSQENLRSVEAMGKIGNKKRTNSMYTGGKSPNIGTLRVLPHTPTSHSEFRQQLPKTRPIEIGTVRVNRLRLFGCVLISACNVAWLGIVHQNVSKMERRRHPFGSGDLGCASFDSTCYGGGRLAFAE